MWTGNLESHKRELIDFGAFERRQQHTRIYTILNRSYMKNGIIGIITLCFNNNYFDVVVVEKVLKNYLTFSGVNLLLIVLNSPSVIPQDLVSI